MQDLGAAGLTSSAGEMASAGGVGIDLDVARVPLREADMEPFEIMVSESQERMLGVVEPARVPRCWPSARNGRSAARRSASVTDSGQVRVLRGDEVVGEMPVEALVDGCPLYDLSPAEPDGWIYGNRATLREGATAEETLLALLASPSVASKRWAFEQYDSVVGSRTVRRPESADAAVLALPESGNAIAVSIDGNGRRVACDPYAGTVEAVLECAQNLACVGAEPLGLTNCLNFGNPEKPAPAWQLDRAVSGLADACEALGVPGRRRQRLPLQRGTGRADLPDPGRRHGRRAARPGAASPAPPSPREGDAIALLGPFEPTLAGSELAKLRGELDAGLPQPEVAAVAAACETVREAVRAGRLASAHDVSDGGLACAVAECAIGGEVGCRVDLQPLRERGCSPEEALFGEGAGRLPAQRRARRTGGDGRDPDRRGRRNRPRDRRRRPQHHGRPRARGRGLALARKPHPGQLLAVTVSEMRGLKGIAIAAALLGASLATAPSGMAATEIGSNCVGAAPSSDNTLLQLAVAPGSALPITAPAAGVVTRWKVNSNNPKPLVQTFRVFRSTRCQTNSGWSGKAPSRRW